MSSLNKKIYDRDRLREKRKENPQYGQGYKRMYRKMILTLFNNECARCGFSDVRALQIDHVNGGGRKELSKNGNTVKYLKGVIDSFLKKENKYQLLCANCNWIKRVENDES